MSQEYEITWVGDDVREWASKEGHRFVAYQIRVEGDDRVIEWSRKPDSDPPEVEKTTPLADIVNGPHGARLKVDWNAVKEQKGSGGGWTGSSGGSADYKPRSGGKSPDQQASIARQVALKVLAESINKEGLSERVKGICADIETHIALAGLKDSLGATEIPSVAEQAKEAEDDALPF